MKAGDADAFTAMKSRGFDMALLDSHAKAMNTVLISPNGFAIPMRYNVSTT